VTKVFIIYAYRAVSFLGWGSRLINGWEMAYLPNGDEFPAKLKVVGTSFLSSNL